MSGIAVRWSLSAHRIEPQQCITTAYLTINLELSWICFRFSLSLAITFIILLCPFSILLPHFLVLLPFSILLYLTLWSFKILAQFISVIFIPLENVTRNDNSSEKHIYFAHNPPAVWRKTQTSEIKDINITLSHPVNICPV